MPVDNNYLFNQCAMPSSENTLKLYQVLSTYLHLYLQLCDKQTPVFTLNYVSYVTL